jgi:HAD superfamily hydrolase (TIGR01490 family)
MYADDSRTRPGDRPIVAFFDVDNTLLHGAGIYHVGRAAWKRGFIGFRDLARFAWHQFRFVAVGENKKHIMSAQERALQLAEGHPADQLMRLAEDIYEREIETRLWPETVGLAREHLDKGHEVWLITAAPVDIASVIARNLGLTGALGTVLGARDGRFTGELEGPILHGSRKAVAAEELAVRLGAALSDCWAYSDSRNDIPLLELVGNRVVVNPDSVLSGYARNRGWPIMTLNPAAIRAARRRVRRDGKVVSKNKKRQTL